MKIRTGHVSNSSSSSFIIGIPKGKWPTTVDEAQKLIGEETTSCGWGFEDEEQLDSRRISEIFFNDLQGKNPVCLDDIADEFDYSDYLRDLSEIRMLCDETPPPKHSCADAFSEEWKYVDVGRIKYCLNAIARMFAQHDFVILEYEDDTRQGSMMEQGDVFHRLLNIRISKH